MLEMGWFWYVASAAIHGRNKDINVEMAILKFPIISCISK